MASQVNVCVAYLGPLKQEINLTGLEDGWQVTGDHTPELAP